MFTALKGWARVVKIDVTALGLAARDQRVPWYAKAVAIVIVAYALSPIDLVPDFIPVIGYADDLILVPLGIMLAVWLIPSSVMGELRREAVRRERPTSRGGIVIVIAAWLVVAGGMAWLLWPSGIR